MSHELEFQDGRASFFTVKETAWHREGVVLAEAPSFEEAMELARLGYTVEKIHTYIPVPAYPGGPAAMAPSKMAYITRRTDTGNELGSVGPSYQPIQNVDAFAPLIPLLDAGVMRLETGGVLRDGADAWLLAQFDLSKFGPIVKEVFADEVIPFALIQNNHSGRRKVHVQLTPIRVVCANTLGMAEMQADSALDRAIAIPHVGDVEARVVEAAKQLFQGIIERMEVVAKQYRLLKTFYLDEAMFRQLVELPVVGVHPTERKEFNPDARMADAVVKRYEERVRVLRDLWLGGKGHTGDGSAWDAYNGTVEAIDHREDLFPARSGALRLGSLTDGLLAEKKNRVLNNLVTAATPSGEAAMDEDDLPY